MAGVLRAVVKSLESPDETRLLRGKGVVSVVRLGSVAVGRATMEPGWRWSEHVKPLVGTESCEATHTGYVISGQMQVRMDDGDELTLRSGDAFLIPPGHDAWVIGGEPCVTFDFTAMEEFGQI